MTSKKNSIKKLLLINKKAQLGAAVTWLWKFMFLVLVVGGIVFITARHYSKQFDVRDAEASLLSQQLVRCIAPSSVVKAFDNATIKACLSLDERELYINATLDDKNVELGDSFLATLCQAMAEKVKIRAYPACHRSRYLLLKNGKLAALNIFIAIKKTEKSL